MTLWAAAAAGLGFCAVIGLLGVAWWGTELLFHPPKMSAMSVFPEQFGLRYEKISFRTRDGLLLRGWFIPSPTGDERTLLMCHGWGDNKGELLKQTYFLNQDAGFNLVYFDFRSHGESEGRITTIGGMETIDFDAAVAWLKENKPGLAGRLGVFGLSMGAAVTVASMPEHSLLRCAAVESPFSDYRGVVCRWAWKHLRIPEWPLIRLMLWMARLRLSGTRVDTFNPVESAPRIAPRPVLMIAGENDYLMPVHDVRRVFAAAGEPKQLWVVPEAVHAKCREAAGLEYDTRVTGFFRRHL